MITLSPYPRRGHPIAPRLLTPILNVRVPGNLLGKDAPPRLKLCDLDESCWRRFEPEQCDKLARTVVATVAKALLALPNELARVHLSTPPRGCQLDDLQLTRRTHNALRKAGYLKSLPALAALRVQDVLAVPSFGAASLVDLLSALDALHRPLANVSGTPAQLAKRLKQVVEKLLASGEADGILSDDFRLGYLVRRIDSKAESVGELCQRLLSKRGKPPDARSLLPLLKELQQRISECMDLKLEAELRELMPDIRDQTKRRILARRYGWDAKGGATLKVVGDEFGVTRERVRQICDRLVGPLPSRSVFLPAFDRAVQAITEQIPARANRIEKSLHENGQTEGIFRLGGLPQTAMLLDRELPFEIVRVSEQRLAVPSQLSQYVETTLQTARWCVQHWGVCTVAEVAARVEQEANLTVSSEFVTEILDACGDCPWPPRVGGWFSLRSVGRNPLRKLMLKALSISPEISTTQLRVAASRRYRGHGLAPPLSVLLRFCRTMLEFRVTPKSVIADKPPSPEETLSPSELLMLGILRKRGPIMPRDAFRKACLAAGLDSNIYWSNVMKSPVVIDYPERHCGLPGSIDTRPVAHGEQTKRREGVEYAWKPRGKIWLSVELTKTIIATGRVRLPVDLQGVTRGRYKLQTEDAAILGTASVIASEIRGLEILFEQRGGEPGDSLTLTFNRGTRTLHTRLRMAGSFRGR